MRLCDGLFSALYRFDGELIHFVAQHNFTPEAPRGRCAAYSRARPTRAIDAGRAILERAVVHIPDVERDPEYQHQRARPRGRLSKRPLRANAAGGRSHRRHRRWRAPSPGRSPTARSSCCKTFADQAVIAIENVRLFKELQARTRRADAVGRAADGAGRGQPGGQLDAGRRDRARHHRLPGEPARGRRRLRDLRVRRGDARSSSSGPRTTYDAALVETLRAAPLRKGEGVMGRAAETREPIQIPDIAAAGRLPEPCPGHARPVRATGRCSPCRCSARTRSSAACP